MISKNELRLGNYFWWAEVEGFGQGLGQITHPQQIADYADFKEPIPITEIYMIRFGFKGEGAVWYISPKNLKGTYEFDLNTGWFDDGLNQIKTHEVKYVHQLQNLYFALTNEELELK